MLTKISLLAAFVILLTGLSFIFTSAQNESEAINVLPDYTSCVKISSGSSSISNQSINFYNSCPTRLYFKACVKDTMGELKLYTSPTYVKTNGNWTLYAFPGVTPSKISWNTAPYAPETPDMCKTALKS